MFGFITHSDALKRKTNPQSLPPLDKVFPVPVEMQALGFISAGSRRTLLERNANSSLSPLN